MLRSMDMRGRLHSGTVDRLEQPLISRVLSTILTGSEKRMRQTASVPRRLYTPRKRSSKTRPTLAVPFKAEQPRPAARSHARTRRADALRARRSAWFMHCFLRWEAHSRLSMPHGGGRSVSAHDAAEVATREPRRPHHPAAGAGGRSHRPSPSLPTMAKARSGGASSRAGSATCGFRRQSPSSSGTSTSVTTVETSRPPSRTLPRPR